MADRLRSFGLPLLGALLALAVSLWAFGVIVDEQIVEDVLAGYAAGVAWLALLYVALEVRARYTLQA